MDGTETEASPGEPPAGTAHATRAHMHPHGQKRLAGHCMRAAAAAMHACMHAYAYRRVALIGRPPGSMQSGTIM